MYEVPQANSLSDAISQSAFYVRTAIDWFAPTHIVTMVSGGKDSAVCHALAMELGLPITMTIHGHTGCGLPAARTHVEDHYGKDADLVIADAGTAYQDYALRKGFFGKGVDAHKMAYHVLKAGPFRKTISAELRKGKRAVRVLLLNGAFKAESANRKATLKRATADPAAPMNLWFNLIHDWTPEWRDEYLLSRSVPVSPVAKALCRSGECMCGTMQTQAERIEAAAFDPIWGQMMDDLEAEVRAIHGFGWGENKPSGNKRQPDLFMPMCVGCGKDTPND